MEIIDITTKLSNCADIITGRNIDKKKLNEQNQGLPYIVGASDIVNGTFVPRRYIDAKSIKNPGISKQGDILVSCVGTLGKIGVNTVGDAVLSAHVFALRIKKGISRQYFIAMLTRLILEAIPDKDGDVTMGFQNKLDIERIKNIEFLLPELTLQEYLVSRLTAITMIILAYRGERADFLSFDRMVSLIEQERAEQRKHFRKLSESLEQIQGLLQNLPQDSDTLQLIGEAQRAHQRLIKIN